jgi:acetyltransferase
MELAKLADRSGKPLTAFAMATQNTNDYGREFKERCRLPFLEGARNSVRALVHLGAYSAALKRIRGDEGRSVAAAQPLTPRARELLRQKPILSEWQAYQVLSDYGVPIAKTAFARDTSGAAHAAETMGYPVAVKVAASNATHKSELGGVRLGLASDAAVERACREMASATMKARPDISLEGFLIQEMVGDGVETIIGTINSPKYGPAIMFGLGGKFVEVYQDLVFRLAPVTKDEALVMIRAIKGYPLLTGFRGAPAVDLASLAAVLVRVSELASSASDTIQSLDINPFIALPEGGKAVDALIVTLQAG